MSSRRSTSAPSEVLIPRFVMIMSTAVLLCVGLIMVFSASTVWALNEYGDAMYYFDKQLQFVLLGVVVAYVVSRIDYRRLLAPTLSWAYWVVSVMLLAATIKVGEEGRLGAVRWLDVGVTTIQPSEIAKLATILLVAHIIVQWHAKKVTGAWAAVCIVSVSGITLALIGVQPDLGTMVIIALSVLVVVFLGGVRKRWVFGSAGVSLALLVPYALGAQYRRDRIFAAFNPWLAADNEGYQVVKAMLAFASGGIGGVGVGLSKQKFGYLPEAHTDFIFAIIGEEAGLLGATGVLLAFVAFAWAGFQIARYAPDRYGKLVAAGATFMIILQAFINILCVVGLMPVTGKPLPFISAGGSSLVISIVAVGLILSVSMRSDGKCRAERKRESLRVVGGGVR